MNLLTPNVSFSGEEGQSVIGCRETQWIRVGPESVRAQYRAEETGRNEMMQPSNPNPALNCVLKSAITPVIALALCGGLMHAQSAGGDAASGNDLLRRVLDNEIQAQTADHTHWRYRSSSGSDKDCKKEEIIQTKDGEIGHLVLVGSRPLTVDEERKEEDRIEAILNNPEQQRKKQRDAAEDAKRAEHVLRTLPQAVIATYGRREGDLQELNFKPHPSFSPSTREDQVLHALAGKIWVNTRENRLAEISGYLVETVKFGGGLLGYLEQGGQFVVKQSEVGSGHWEVTSLHVNMKGKALCFKTINVHQEQTNSDYERVSDDLTLAQGANELRHDLHATAHLQR